MSGDFLDTSRPVLDWVLRTTWEASLIAAMVLLAQHLLRGRVSARWRYNLWLLVVARLLLPAVPGTQFSPFNLVQLPQPPRAPAAPRAVPVVRPKVIPTPPVRVIPVPGPADEPERRQSIYFASTASAPQVAAAEIEPAVAARVTEPLIVRPTPDPLATEIRDARPLATLSRPALSAAPPTHVAAPATIAHTAAAPVVPWHRRVNWGALAAVVWIAGAAFAAARLAWVSLRLAVAVRGLRPVSDPALAQILSECAAQLRLRRTPRVLEAPDGFGPALVGLIRPRVVLPACVLRGPFKRDELRLVLMHELAHMKRWDVAANWLLAVLGVVHWFNPVLRLTFRRMRLDRELACDELVLSATAPTVARAYGPTLLKLLQTLSRRPALPGMVGVLEGKPSIRRRIAMIARFDRSNRNSSPLFGLALSVLAGGVALTGAVRGQQSPPEPPGEVRELSVELTREDDDASRERAEAEREARETQRQAAREAEDQARAAAREAEDEARNAAREAEDQAREAAREADDQARQSKRECLEAAREAFDGARDRAREMQEALTERQQAARERAKEAEEAIAEAQRDLEQRTTETQREIDESRKAMDEAQQQAVNQEQDLRKQLDDAKQLLVDHQAKQPAEGDDDAAREAAERLQELTGAVEEKERDLADAASEREQALRDGNAELERAVGERENTLQEARVELERATGEHQEAIAEAAREVDQAARDLEGATAELAVARDALAQAQGAEQAAPAEPLPTPELPPTETTAPEGVVEPIPAEPPPAPEAPPAGIGPVVSVSVTTAAEPGATPAPNAIAATAAVSAAPPTSYEPTSAEASSTAAPAVAAGPASLPPTPAPAAEAPPTVSAGGPAVAVAPPTLTPTPRAGPARRAATPYAMPGMPGGYGGNPGYGGGYPNPPGNYPGYGRGGGYPGAAQPAPGGMPGGGMTGMGGGAVAPRGADAGPAPAARIENPAARDADRRTNEALRRSLPVNFENVPLEEVLRFIADAAKVDVIADWKGLEAAGIDRSASVSLTLRQGAPAEQVITWVLRAAGGEVLGYAIDHGVVVVAPQERIDRMVITRAYPLGGMADGGQALESLVRDTVAPQSWRENGGVGSVRFFNTQLFVTATEPNHRQVERLLGLMEAQNVHKPSSGTMPGMGGYPGMMPGGIPGGAPTAAPARR